MKTFLRAILSQHFPFPVTNIPDSIFSKKSFALLVFMTLAGAFSLQVQSQSISVPVITGTPVCAGATVTATFDVTNGGAGNHFTNSTTYQAYISDASGNNFITLGTTFSLSASYSILDGVATTGLQQALTIPANYPTGTG